MAELLADTATFTTRKSTRLWIFWLQTLGLTMANLKSRYRHTFAGFLWVVLNPMILYGTQSYVFHIILKLQVDRYPLFLLSGLLPWIFIVQSIEMCTGLLTNSARLLKSFPIHPFVFLASQLLDNLINFSAAFAVLLVPTLLTHQITPLGLLALPIPLVLLFFAVFGMTWMLSTLHVFFRDTRFIVSFLMNVLFFLTPIFYPIDFVPQPLRWIVAINPFYLLIRPFRACLYEPNAQVFVHDTALAGLVAMASCLIAALYWNRRRNEVYHLL
jgi:ABC-type polysaccharide/polyol phosphate export permease